MPERMVSMGQPSIRLIQVSRTRGAEPDRPGMEDLRVDLGKGRYSWLERELAGLLQRSEAPAGW